MQTLITDVDRHRISTSIDWLPGTFKRGSGLGRLLQRLHQAVAVDPRDIPANCVTMNSHVRLRYHSTDEVRDLRLVYPNGPPLPDGGPDPVSVISPVGAALLGSRAGDVIEWKAPGGMQQGDVVAILYQPEANGDPD